MAGPVPLGLPQPGSREGLVRAGLRPLEPAYITMTEDWVVKPEEYDKLMPDSGETDVFFI